MKKTITIYGAGYVGLVTGVCLAEMGNDVLLVDTQHDRISMLAQGICPIFEPYLEEFLQRHLARKRLAFSTDLSEGVKHGFFQIIAVGTPSSEDGSADLHHVFDVASSIAEKMTEYRVIVNKSTSTIGTAHKVKQLIQTKLTQRKLDIHFDVVSNPEFLKQGNAIQDFLKPDRIIFGTDNARALKYMCDLYATLDDNSQRFIAMDTVSAEFSKYAANAFLAAKISFINEMSQLAERFHADIDMIRRGLGSDQRIGHHFLFAGCGFGGSCFPKDVLALKKMAETLNYDTPFLNAILTINKRQKNILFSKISRYFNANLTGKTIALWGLSFKPNTDDMREAPSQTLIESLLTAGAQVQAYDPAAAKVAKKIYSDRANFKIGDNQYDVLNDADVLVVITEWDEFRHPDFNIIKKTLRYPVIFDGRNIYLSEVLAEHGFQYYAIGRGDQLPV